MGRGEDPELRQDRLLRRESYFFAVAQIASRTGERRSFTGLREEANEVRNHARCSDAWPELFHAAGVTFVAGKNGAAETLRAVLRVALVTACH